MIYLTGIAAVVLIGVLAQMQNGRPDPTALAITDGIMTVGTPFAIMLVVVMTLPKRDRTAT